jgi:hypothetical protein
MVEFSIGTDGTKKRVELDKLLKWVFLDLLKQINNVKKDSEFDSISIGDLLFEYKCSINQEEKNEAMRKIILKGKRDKKKKYDLGWRETPDGFLSPKDIRDAGFVLKDGEYRYPGIEEIADHDMGSVKKGQKHMVIDPKYFEWKRKKIMSTEERIENFAENKSQIDLLRSINFFKNL